MTTGINDLYEVGFKSGYLLSEKDNVCLHTKRQERVCSKHVYHRSLFAAFDQVKNYRVWVILIN